MKKFKNTLLFKGKKRAFYKPAYKINFWNKLLEGLVELEKEARFPAAQVNRNLWRGFKSQKWALYIHANMKSFRWKL